MKKKILLFISMLACTALQAQNAYINKVYDFCPAPGQYVNTMPQYNAGDTKESILERVNATLCKESAGVISLGGYGGYVVFGFDHRVENQTGKMDFEATHSFPRQVPVPAGAVAVVSRESSLSAKTRMATGCQMMNGMR